MMHRRLGVAAKHDRTRGFFAPLATLATALPLPARLKPAAALTAVRPRDPSEALFGRIRRQLALWYCGALAAMLLVGGTLLYVGVQHALLDPVPGYLSNSAQLISASWSHEWGEHGPLACDQPSGIPAVALQHVPYVWCVASPPMDRKTPGLPAAFLGSNLAQTALASSTGQVSGTIIGENSLGAISCYALVVHDPVSGNAIGVVQVGIPIQGSLDALHTMLIILLVIGALTIVGAAAAGLWLAGRAMQPAYLSFARQQAFIGDAAHELRTPITLMRADAEVLLRGRAGFSEDDAALLEDIVAETAHMGNLATNLLTLARLDAGKAHLERDVVDLGEIAEGVARRVRALAAERHLTLNVEASAPVLVLADRALLEQAALILVDNAVKYNRPDGAISLRVAREGTRALLVVRDTGIGVPAEHLPHLGERFYRVDKARSREAGGAGLGLSIARGIAAAHGGTLTLTSDPGSGTTATLSLPAA
jgi:signal transduction histidine kinase